MRPGPLLLAAATAVLLAGCAEGPVVPHDAARATSDVGLVLHAWTEEQGDAVLLHGVLRNDGGLTIRHRIECGRPWLSAVDGPEGPVDLHVKAPCDEFFYDVLQPGQSRSYRYSWNLRHHPGGGASGEPVPPGLYTWSLGVESLTPHLGHVETRIPVAVGDDGWTAVRDPAHPALSLRAQVQGLGDRQRLVAEVANEGPESVVHPSRCGAAWEAHVARPGGAALAQEGECTGVESGVLDPGATQRFITSWDGAHGPEDTQVVAFRFGPGDAGRLEARLPAAR